MGSLLFGIFAVIVAILNVAWDFLVPKWAIIAFLIAYICILDAEFDLISKVKEALWWAIKRFSSGR